MKGPPCKGCNQQQEVVGKLMMYVCLNEKCSRYALKRDIILSDDDPPGSETIGLPGEKAPPKDVVDSEDAVRHSPKENRARYKQ